ncbi:hypothetical protein [Dictyobacter formicarum]|uniref:Tetratricopeptide repeat protein n=1 Tax=Dictyobacter formicarum TaxID=2778368 RepID=A0ABQ3VRX4_9CHLR|nr:hypothetical protein [Dictyobacter formicarum]GHO89024.1 hypothetical protein KSZ_70300 [Dictyobacter formicarum]
MQSPARSQYMNENYSSLFSATNRLDTVNSDAAETALSAYEQAIFLAPREAVLYYHKGQVLEQLGRTTEAKAAYTEARLLGHRC